MVLRRKAMTPTREWEAVVVDSVPELDEVVEVTTPAVGAEEDVEEDSAPELDEADLIGGLVVLDTPPIFWLPPSTVCAEEDVEDWLPPSTVGVEEVDEAVAIGCGRTGRTANLLTVSKVF